MGQRATTAQSDLEISAEVRPILIRHAHRGFALQVALRAVLVLFLGLTLALVPPDDEFGLSAMIAAGYGVTAITLSLWLIGTRVRAARWGWTVLYLDLAALSALALVAGIDAAESWTADVLLRGFFLLPVLAATQLRVRVCAGVVVPATVVYLATSIATRQANDEPWQALWLRCLVMVAVSAAAVGLTMLQRSRVRIIESLVLSRTELLAELTTASQRERRAMAEDLHDGALQYLLGARFDLEDLRDSLAPSAAPAVDRLDRAITESTALLRGAVTELHPAVLDAAGLATAVTGLARAAADRAGFTLQLELQAWPADRREPLDGLLFRAAAELIANVVRHAGATSLRVELGLDDGIARLVVVDDGVGIDPVVLASRVREGHIGLQSNRVRIEAAGGQVHISSTPGAGTRTEITLPTASSQVDHPLG